MVNSTKNDLRVVHNHIEKIMPLVVRKPGGWFPYTWIATSYDSPYNDTQFVWDAFHECLRFIYAGKPEYFKNMTSNHFHYQTSNGWMPVAIHKSSGLLIPEYATAQPFLAQSVFLYLKNTSDKTWPEEIYKKLKRYFAYWETERYVEKNLCCWGSSMESGYDNDAVFSFSRPRSVAAVSASALMWIEHRTMSLIAEALGRNKDASFHAKRADAIKETINKKLWCEELGCYANIDTRTRKPIVGLGVGGLSGETGAFSFLTWNSMMALYPKLASEERARRHIENYLLNPAHFWSPYGIRSLSAKSEYYNNAIWGNPARYSDEKNLTASNWQGPVWFPVNYFVFHALINYGYLDKAEELADRTVRVIANNIRQKGCMYENYSAETGEGLYAPAFASWNILADKMHDELRTGKWILHDIIFCCK